MKVAIEKPADSPFVVGITRTFGGELVADVTKFEGEQDVYVQDFAHYPTAVPKFEGYRVCVIGYTPTAFGCAIGGLRKIAVHYRQGLFFNIVPPECPKYGGTLYDYIYTWKDKPVTEEGEDALQIKLLPDELKFLTVFPNGVSVDSWEAFGGPKPPTHAPFFRLGWKLSAPSLRFPELIYWVHPEHNRLLTNGELAVLCGMDYLPETPVYTSVAGSAPFPVGVWLGAQLGYCVSGGWNGQDFQSTYDGKRYIAEHCHGEEIKKYDLINLRQNNENRKFPPLPHKLWRGRNHYYRKVW